MSLAVGAVSSSSNMGFHENKEREEKSTGDLDTAKAETTDHESDVDEGEPLRFGRKMSESSLYMTEDEEDEEGSTKIEVGPQCSLKEQLEKDKDDESLRKWKEQLLGSVDLNSIGETIDPEVKILSLSILSPDRPEIVLPIPEGENPKGLWFTLKEGCCYSLKFSFQVSNNIVSGLRYTSTVWKTGVKVDSAKEMLGTFCPQPEPYVHVMPEDTTPSGIFARGQYSAKSKFLDDDNNCYLEISYTFDIQRGWAFT